MLKRVLLLTFCLGCTVSMLASGRFTPRLIADGMLSFAFVPACELAGFALSRRLLVSRGRFADDAERFLHGNWPWLAWMLGLAAVAAASTGEGFSVFNLLIIAALLPLFASIWIDYRFFKDGQHDRRRRAITAVFVQRAVAWPFFLFYLLGMAVPARDFLHLFVELRDILANSIKVLFS